MAVPISRLETAIELLAEHVPGAFVEEHVRTVVFARSFEDLHRAGTGDAVVLDDALRGEVPTYRFDLALGRAGDDVPTVIVPASAEPSITALRLAASRGIVLARLRAGHDVTSVSKLLHFAETERGKELSVVVQSACELIDTMRSPDDIVTVLADLGELIGADVAIAPERQHADDAPIRVHGVERGVVQCDLPEHPLHRALLSHLARTIEETLIRGDEATHITETARSSLLNELLLGDAGTTADSASRLRRAGFPVDGSHTAIRIDCHDPVPDRRHADLSVKQRLATLVTDHLRTFGDGTWTRAGTANSIIVVGSHRGAIPEDDAARGAAEELIELASDAVDRVQLFVGIGGTHGGVAGLSQSVMEATTAARAASARSTPNVPHHIDRLGLSRALVQWAEIDGVRPVLDEILGPLEGWGGVKADRAITTLKTYLDCGRNVNLTASLLGIHRNTARYRVERISDALDVNLDDADDRLLLELACRVRDSRSQRA